MAVTAGCIYKGTSHPYILYGRQREYNQPDVYSVRADSGDAGISHVEGFDYMSHGLAGGGGCHADDSGIGKCCPHGTNLAVLLPESHSFLATLTPATNNIIFN